MIHTWADAHIGFDATTLTVAHDEQPTVLSHTAATGRTLTTVGRIGADIIRLAAGTGFPYHAHPGDHILIPVAGEGTVTADGTVTAAHAGTVYLIEGGTPHAVGAVTDHVLIAVGAPHRTVDDPARMTLVEYAAAAADTTGLRCAICPVDTAGYWLHETGCGHCPCPECVPPLPTARHGS